MIQATQLTAKGAGHVLRTVLHGGVTQATGIAAKGAGPASRAVLQGGSDPGHRARCGRVPTLSHTLCCKGGGDPGHRARCGKVPTLSHTLCCKGGGHKARWSDVLALPGTLRCKGWPCPMLTGRKHPWTMISLYNTAL